MSGINNSEIVQVLCTLILGKVSFLISGIIACIVILRLDNYILGTLIAGSIGGLLLGLFLCKHKMIGRMTVAGFTAILIGFLGSFSLIEGLIAGFGLLFPSIAANFENSNIPDIIAIILMGIVFGTVFGAIVYGRKSILLFSAVCGAVSIPFGLLVGAMNSGHWIRAWLGNLFMFLGNIDLNFLAIVIEFGIGVGLSIGLYTIVVSRNH